MNIYKTKRWIKKRGIILRRDEYLCRHCKRFGNRTPATLVHHIFPLNDYPQYAFNTDNLLSVCNKCHEKFHDRITDVLTATGQEWVERMRSKIIGNG